MGPSLVLHLRAVPAISHGVTSFVWAIVFALYILIGGIGVGFSDADCFVVAVVVGAGTFLFVRICGEDRPD